MTRIIRRALSCLRHCTARDGASWCRGPVVAEVGYLLGREGGPRIEAQFLKSLADNVFHPVDVIDEDYRRAAELVLIYEDLPLGTTDATVLALCDRLGVAELATLDRRHFTVVRPRHVHALTLLPERLALRR